MPDLKFNFNELTLDSRADITQVDENFKKIEELALTADSIPDVITPELIGAEPALTYHCSGTADSSAISALINSFFSNGTAMTLKLIVRGEMGIELDCHGEYAMRIDAQNDRGAVCFVDFSDCDIPTYSSDTKGFLHICSPTVRLNITGLFLRWQRPTVFLDNASGNCFSSCRIESGVMDTCNGVYLKNNSCNNTFSNCTFTEELRIAYASNNNSFLGCTVNRGTHIYSAKDNCFVNCLLTHDNCEDYLGTGVQLHGFSTGNKFTGCTLTSSRGSALWLSGDWNNDTFVGCTIVSDTLANSGSTIYIDPTFFGTVTFAQCRILSTDKAIYLINYRDTTDIKLIGCTIKGSQYDICASNNAPSTRFHITGCTFSGSSVSINGESGITHAISNFVYMPQYANWFGRTIE